MRFVYHAGHVNKTVLCMCLSTQSFDSYPTFLQKSNPTDGNPFNAALHAGIFLFHCHWMLSRTVPGKVNVKWSQYLTVSVCHKAVTCSFHQRIGTFSTLFTADHIHYTKACCVAWLLFYSANWSLSFGDCFYHKMCHMQWRMTLNCGYRKYIYLICILLIWCSPNRMVWWAGVTDYGTVSTT